MSVSTSHAGSVLSDGKVTETVAAYVPSDFLRQLAEAELVELRVGVSQEAALDYGKREPLRALAALLDSSGF